MRIKLTLKREQDVSLEEKLSFTVVKSLHRFVLLIWEYLAPHLNITPEILITLKYFEEKNDIVGYNTCKTLTRILVYRFDLKVDHEYQLGKMMASMVKSFKIHHIQVILP